MRRAVLVILLTLLTFNVSGLAALCGDPACDEDCSTDVSGGQCPPNCHSCSCCSIPKMAGSGRIALATPSERPTFWASPLDLLPSPEPADILDVPKLRLA